MNMLRWAVLCGLLATACAPQPPLRPTNQPPAPQPRAENPCADERYLELKSVPLDSMSDREFEFYQARDEACVAFQREQALQAQQVASQRETVRSAERATGGLTSAIVITALVGAAVTLFVMGAGG